MSIDSMGADDPSKFKFKNPDTSSSDKPGDETVETPALETPTIKIAGDYLKEVREVEVDKLLAEARKEKIKIDVSKDAGEALDELVKSISYLRKIVKDKEQTMETIDMLVNYIKSVIKNPKCEIFRASLVHELMKEIGEKMDDQARRPKEVGVKITKP